MKLPKASGPVAIGLFLIALGRVASPDAADEFAHSVRPVLAEHCGRCHNPANPKSRIDFLKAATPADMEKNRGLWRNVAAQLRNRTMPPADSKLSEDDRLRIAKWVDDRLRETACNGGDYAGSVSLHRLNRREYHHTVRDIFGVDLPVSDIFPADGSGGAGFDTNAETLFIPPVLMERYLEAAQQVLDRAIVTPTLNRTYAAAELEATSGDRETGGELAVVVPVHIEGQYGVRVSLEGTESPVRLELKVDGFPTGELTFQPRSLSRGPSARIQVSLARGTRKISVQKPESPIRISSLALEQRPEETTPEKRALHYRLFGMEPGETPVQPRKAAQLLLGRILRKAYRRPVTQPEIDRFLTMYDRAAERGDPYEERIKLALKAALVSPGFLFRMEQKSDKPGIYPLGQYELATRLSYFLWSTMPDEELSRLAEQGRLQDTGVLAAQVERMLNDPRARTFTSTFIGQWLGTQDLGGRVVPMLTELQSFYYPDVAADLRAEPVLLFQHLLAENRSLLELLTADYTFLTERLVKFYQLEGQVKVNGNTPQLVTWPDNRRAGVLGLGAVLAMTSHYNQTSPVLRGAWALETLLGTPVPPPPPDVPPLETAGNKKSDLTVRQKVMQHQANPACSTCHKLMDPIGFGLENFDWMGRWRNKEKNGQPIDATGSLPTGEKFSGPAELRQALLARKDEFVRHVTAKVLGYALGRSLQDGDHCTVQRLVDTVREDNYKARTLIREVVLSVPFRNSQGGTVAIEHVPPPPRRAKPMVTK
jgi:hypothetical protein